MLHMLHMPIPQNIVLYLFSVQNIHEKDTEHCQHTTHHHTPWYIKNNDLDRDNGIDTVTDIITNFVNSHEKSLQNHINHRSVRTS
jgi:hypothetical protein